MDMSKRIYKQEELFSTNDYNDLTKKPSVNGFEISGDVSLQQLSLYSKEQINNIISNRAEHVVLEKPELSEAIPNSVYYVGEEAPYDVYYYSEDEYGNVTENYLGTSGFLSFKQYLQTTEPNLKTVNKEFIDAIDELDSVKQNKTDSELLTSSKDVIGAINEIYNSMSLYQNDEEESLKTDSKEIVGAINEIYDKTTIKLKYGRGLQSKDGVICHTEGGLTDTITCYTDDENYMVLPSFSIDRYGHVLSCEYTKMPSLLLSPMRYFHNITSEVITILDVGLTTRTFRIGLKMVFNVDKKIENSSDLAKAMYTEYGTFKFPCSQRSCVRAVKKDNDEYAIWYYPNAGSSLYEVSFKCNDIFQSSR